MNQISGGSAASILYSEPSMVGSNPDTSSEVMETPVVNQVEQVAGPSIIKTSNEVATVDDLKVLQYPCFIQNVPYRFNPDTSLEVIVTPKVNQVEQIAGSNESERSHEVATEDNLEVIHLLSFTQNLPERANPDTSSEKTSNEVATEDKIQVGAVSRLGDGHLMVSTLGEGAFGLVIKCFDTKKKKQGGGHQTYQKQPETADLVRREIAILEKLRCLEQHCNVEWLFLLQKLYMPQL